ncbi:MAG: PAS domain S-box protein [Spirochaetales bacterium]|nr:PAS domain S-box protein [Spirochaetales bacterium]
MDSAGKKLVLLVEDDAIIALDERYHLESYGYAVRVARNGEQGIEAFRSEPTIDIVLMDIDLGPGLDGTEAARAMLAERKIPVVFLSSHTERELVERTESITSYGYVVKNSGITVLDASMKMAFKLFETERELLKQNTVLRAVMENAPIGFAVNTISDGRGLLVAKKFRELYGIPDGGTETVDDFFESVYVDTVQREAMRGRVLADMRSGDPARMRWENIQLRYRSSGEFKVVTAMNIPVIEHDLMVSTVQDVTERWEVEQALRASEARFRGFVENATDLVYELDPEGRFTYLSPKWLELLGYGPEEGIGQSFEPYVHPDDLPACREMFARAMSDSPSGVAVDYRVRRSDGTWRWHSSRGTAVRDADGKPLAFLGIARDVTESKQADAELRSRVEDRELLLKEAHHRIKNNIASIQGLLSMQERMVEDPAAVAALRDSIGRIGSMRVLYEKLLDSGDGAELPVGSWLESLAATIVDVFPAPFGLRVEVEADDFSLAPKRLFPLGIALNELLTNALKHAFVSGASDPPELRVSLRRADGRVELVVRDNGVGFPEGSAERKPGGFGLSLVFMLAEQLGGEFRVSGRRGTEARFAFDA